MNGNLFKIVLVSVVAILLAIIGGIMSADGDPLSIVLAVSPFILAALFLMKEKCGICGCGYLLFLLFREFFNLHPFVCLWNCSAILLVEYHA